ncbi:hypothetical protein O6379_23875, partial [Salmonella enterica subsp. enterica]|nr:hypothetical protein [Salmonella enterica]
NQTLLWPQGGLLNYQINRSPHGQQTGLKYIQLINFLYRGLSHSACPGMCVNCARKRVSLLGGECF